jgi:hypothetical protein
MAKEGDDAEPDLPRRLQLLRTQLQKPEEDIPRLFPTELDVGTMSDIIDALGSLAVAADGCGGDSSSSYYS